MNAKEFNAKTTAGSKRAGDRVPALRRKYESVLRANAKKTRAAYLTVTGASAPSEDPSSLIDEASLKVALTARTAAERKRMARAVAGSILGTAKPDVYDATLVTLASAQAKAATKAVRDALTKVIADSLAEGWSVPETADRIETTLSDYASWEAERLARTDLVGISNAVSLASAETLGDLAPPFKRWLSAGDEKVRPSHREANGSTVATGKTFSVGGFPMDHPGDFLAPYDETMNCRCTLIYLDTANASTAHSFEGGIVEDPIAEAVAAAGTEVEMEDEPEVVAAAVDFSAGMMIALYPEGPDRLAVPGGQSESDLHLTLCFLPNGVDGDRQTLIDLLTDIANLTQTLDGEVGGMGFFAPGPDGVPAIALPDVVGLNELRTAVAAAVEASGTTYATSHGFLPHITLLYVPEVAVDGEPAAETPDVLGMPLVFPALTLKEGDMRFDFAFASDPADTVGEMDAISAATFPAEVRRKLAVEGVAMKDGSFPIRNRADLGNAVASLGRASDPAAAKKHIIKRARALGAIAELPEKWGITAAGADLLLDEVDPWYLTAAVLPRPGDEPEVEEQEIPPLAESAPVAGIVAEVEARYRGNQRPNPRFGSQLPPEYDSVRAARETGLAGTNGLIAAGFDETQHPRHPKGDPLGGKFRPKAFGELQPGDVTYLEGLPGFTPDRIATVQSIHPLEPQVMENGSIEETTHVKFDNGSTMTAGNNEEVLVHQPGLTPDEAASFARSDALRAKENPPTSAPAVAAPPPNYEALARNAESRIQNAPTQNEREFWQRKADEYWNQTPGLTSSAAPLAPPDEWFADPELEAPTPLTVTAEGRVYGHLGEWGKCHTGIGGRCVMIPRSSSGYAEFHNGGLVLASGDEIRVGKLTLNTGHAPLQAGASLASAHYDHTGHVGAFVRAGEDQFGPWLAGAVRSDATPEQIRDLRANPPSGDWRKLAGRTGLELIAALAVPVQGFPVAAMAASGEITAFVSGWDDSGELALVASAEVEDLEREFRLLEARLDGIDGLAALVAANPYHDKVGRFDFAMRAREAKAMRNSNELDEPPVFREEVGRVDAPGTYGNPSHAVGDRVRTGEGHLGEVVGHSHSGSMVRVRREMDGVVESHEPGTLTREGSRAAKLPPREPALRL